MVLLGGLEILAAGYLINKHKKTKQERMRLEIEEQQAEEARRARHRRRRRKHPHNHHHHQEASGKYKSPQWTVPPPQYNHESAYYPTGATKQTNPHTAPPIPHSYIPSTLQPHHTPQRYLPSAYSDPATSSYDLSYPEMAYPHMAEMSSEPERRNDHPISILRQNTGERRRISEDGSSPHVHFALPGEEDETHVELHATTPPPAYVP